MLSRADVLVAGCGDVGTGVALALREAGCRVWGLRRRAELLPAQIERIAADITRPAELAAVRQREFGLVVVATAAGRFDAATYREVYVEGLRNLLDALRGAPRVLLVSSTGVYHQHLGEWVDEGSPTEPTAFSGRLLLEAEHVLAATVAERGCTVRFGGIYGPGRERLLREVLAGIGCPRDPVRYTNRIHRDDCVGMLCFLAERLLRGGTDAAALYLGVDCEPAPMWEVRHWLAARLGVTLDDKASAVATMRGVGSKRCSNRRILRAGYRFRYPDYRAGYESMLRGAEPTPP